MKLSKARINSLEVQDKDYCVWDSTLPGFGVRVRPSGTKTFLLQYRNKFGRLRRYTLGRVGQLTLDQARDEAIRLRGGISLGNDPSDARAQLRQGDTVNELADRYLEDHCEGRCKESTKNAHIWLLGRYIRPKFGTRKINELTAQDVATLHRKLKDTPYNANRVLGLVKAMFNKAAQWGLIEPHRNPALPVKAYRERKRQRYLTPDELKGLFRVIDQQEHLKLIDPYQAAAIRLLALTGCRLSEILTLEWDVVDLANKRLLLAQHKTDAKGLKAIPLNGPAVEVLKQLAKTTKELTDARRRKGEHITANPFVIAGRKDGSHLVNLQKPWNRVRKVAKLEDVRIHDLRHSFASAAASAGIPLQIIGGLLGHSSPQSTARYAHLAQDPINQASNVVGAIISESEVN